MGGQELLPACSWEFLPDAANVYSLCTVRLARPTPP